MCGCGRLCRAVLFWGFPLLSGCGGRADSSERDPHASGGSAAATGGAPSTDDPHACTADEDCTRCLYVQSPTRVDDCAASLGCCGGAVMKVATCDANEAAFRIQCSERKYDPPVCPCISPGLCEPDGTSPVVGCHDGLCGLGCDR
jgi:hypothetical protein